MKANHLSQTNGCRWLSIAPAEFVTHTKQAVHAFLGSGLWLWFLGSPWRPNVGSRLSLIAKNSVMLGERSHRQAGYDSI
jgi:hypothetical protein